MLDSEKEIVDDKLTQSDLIKLMLHNAQHMATREEVKADIKELREEVKADIKELREEVKADIKELKLDNKLLREEVKSDIKELREEVKVLGNKFNNIAWMGLFGIIAILSKEYIIALFTKG